MSEEALAEAAAAVQAMQAQASTLMQNIDSAIVAIRALERRVRAVVERQANDPRLWLSPGVADVTDLQAALRELHAAVEGEDVSWLSKGAR